MTAGGVIVGGDGFRFTKTAGHYRVGINAHLGEVIPDGGGAAFREGLVVVVGAH